MALYVSLDISVVCPLILVFFMFDLHSYLFASSLYEMSDTLNHNKSDTLKPVSNPIKIAKHS
jgi:hypothetical protein